MSDTPITDAALIERRHIHKRDGSVQLLELVDAEIARKLERKRNSLQDQRDFCMGEIERLRKERDEAREEAELLRATLVACESRITDGGYAESGSGQVVYEKANKTLEFVK